MRELRNWGNYVGGDCFSRKLMICLESHWCALSSASRAGKWWRGGVVCEQQTVDFHPSRLWAVVQEACCHGGKWLWRFFRRSQVGANPSAICLLRGRLFGVVVEWSVERVLMWWEQCRQKTGCKLCWCLCRREVGQWCRHEERELLWQSNCRIIFDWRFTIDATRQALHYGKHKVQVNK